MKLLKLTMLNFMALCCILGIFTKKLINPFANVITEALHIPGGVSTSFSIMFLVVAAEIVKNQQTLRNDPLFKNCGTLMGAVQGFTALALGRVGSMGILMPLAFIATGTAIDLVYAFKNRFSLNRVERMVFSNALAAVAASLTANLIVFHLRGPVLWLYLCVSMMSGIGFGYLGFLVVNLLYRTGAVRYGVAE